MTCEYQDRCKWAYKEDILKFGECIGCNNPESRVDHMIPFKVGDRVRVKSENASGGKLGYTFTKIGSEGEVLEMNIEASDLDKWSATIQFDLLTGSTPAAPGSSAKRWAIALSIPPPPPPKPLPRRIIR